MEATGGDIGQAMPEELCWRSDPGETSYPEGPNDGAQAPWLQYEGGLLRVWQTMGVQARGRGEGVGEGWWNGACLRSTEEVGSGEE